VTECGCCVVAGATRVGSSHTDPIVADLPPCVGRRRLGSCVAEKVTQSACAARWGRIRAVAERAAELLGCAVALAKHIASQLGGVANVGPWRRTATRRRSCAHIDLIVPNNAATDEAGCSSLPLEFFADRVDADAVGIVDIYRFLRSSPKPKPLAFFESGKV